MSKQTIFQKFKDMQAVGNISRIQVDTVASLINQRCPDDILTVDGSSGSHAVMLRYVAEGVDLIVDNFDIVISDRASSSRSKVNNSEEGIRAALDLLGVRAGSTQAIVLRSILSTFKCNEGAWAGKWCCLTIVVEKHTVTALVDPATTDVTLYDSTGAVCGTTTGLDTSKPELIIECIDLYIGNSDKIVSNKKSDELAVRTSFFTDNRETSTKNSFSESGSRVSLSKSRGAQEGSISLGEVRVILNGMSDMSFDNCQGTFADGWNEAIATISSRLRIE